MIELYKLQKLLYSLQMLTGEHLTVFINGKCFLLAVLIYLLRALHQLVELNDLIVRHLLQNMVVEVVLLPVVLGVLEYHLEVLLPRA